VFVAKFVGKKLLWRSRCISIWGDSIKIS